jgi:Tfp pilus assembly protein PilN
MIEHINLIPDEIRGKKKDRQRRFLIIGILVLYIIGLGVIYLYQELGIRGQMDKIEEAKKKRDELMARNADYNKAMERITFLQKREDEIKKSINVISSLLEGRIYWSGILRNLTHLIPDSVWFTSLSTYDLTNGKGKGIKFNGSAVSNSGIAEFVFALENSQFFRNVLLGYSQKRELNGKDIYDFEVTVDLREMKDEAGRH